MNYQEMSDYEISCEVGRKISFADYLMARNEQVNYCNSWADAGPIVEKHRITITSLIDGTAWDALSIMGEVEFRDENPLRAAMIVFLMMKEADNAN